MPSGGKVKYLLLSLVENPPPGFTFTPSLSRRDVRSGPFALYSRSVQAAELRLNELGGLTAGIIITDSDGFVWEPRSFPVFHLGVPPPLRSHLSALMPSLLCLLEAIESGGDENRNISLELRRAVEDRHRLAIDFERSRRSLLEEISERKSAEKSLRESEKMLRTIIETTSEGYWLVDPRSMRTLEVNDALCAMLGYTRQEIIGRTPLEFVEDESKDFYLHQMSRIPSTYHRSYEITLRKKSDQKIDAHFCATTLRDESGTPRFAFAFVSDITERKKMEEDQQIFVSLVENSNDFIGIASLDGNMLFLNRTARNLVGLEDVGDIRTVKTRDFAFPKHRSKLDEVISVLQRTGSWKGEMKIRHFKTGGPVAVEMHAFTIKNPKTGEVNAIANISRDISERKALEREMIKVQKLESIGTLAGGIAHDFNNLLSAIAGYVSLARTQVPPGGEVDGHLLGAEKATFRAKDLTQQLLTFSKGGTPVRRAVAVSELIRDSAGLALRGSNVRCDIALPSDLWLIDVDEGQISQVLNNLLINACQAMPAGGEIRVSAGNVVLGIHEHPTLAEGNYVRVSVTDTGIGIPGEHLPKIFDPYFTTKQHGSGLGLATSYAIIKKHQGSITVKSKLGVGTTFHVYLPTSPEKDTGQSRQEEKIIEGKGKILIMDDEMVLREVATAMLRTLGYTTATAKDGAEALELYGEAMKAGEPFDAVIMDLTVPGGMGGQEAITELLKMDPEAKGIASSGYSNNDIMAAYKTYGFSAVVPKPYNLKQLGEVFHRLLPMPI